MDKTAFDAVFRAFRFESKHKSYRVLPFSYLAGYNRSQKVSKGKASGIDTLILYLSPAKSSGFNVCPYATGHCIKACLAESGRALLEARAGKSTIRASRIYKTRFFHINPEHFTRLLFEEIQSASRKAEKRGQSLAVRLNGTSDLSPERFTTGGLNVLQAFPKVTFYDYTKAPERLALAKKYNNYSVTLSYTGEGLNPSLCETTLQAGGTVAVVFNGTRLPSRWKGYPVFDGDKNDLRFLDPAGVVVGLRFKKVARTVDLIANPFIVQP